MKRPLPLLLALLLTTTLAGCCCCPPYGPAPYDPCGGGYCGAPMPGPCGPPPCQPGCCILQPVFCVMHGVENFVSCVLNPCNYGACGYGYGYGCNNYCGMPSVCDPCCAPNLCCDPCGPICGDPCGWQTTCCPAPICCPPTDCCPSTYGMSDCNMGPAPMMAPPAAPPSVPPAANPPSAGQGAYFQRSGLIQSSATYTDARNQRWVPQRY